MRKSQRLKEERLRRKLVVRKDWAGYRGSSYSREVAARVVSAIATQHFQGKLSKEQIEHVMHIAVRAVEEHYTLSFAGGMEENYNLNFKGCDVLLVYEKNKLVSPKLRIFRFSDSLWGVDEYGCGTVVLRSFEEAIDYTRRAWSW